MPRPLPLGVKELERLVERFGTPLQVYDEAGIRANVRHLLDTGAKTFGRFRNYFAVKALPNPAILRILLSEGCGLDCSSAAELELAAVGCRGKGKRVPAREEGIWMGGMVCRG
jgi:diaminopimelate decarboxylase